MSNDTVDLGYDLTNYDRKDFTILSPGDYIGAVEDARIGPTKDGSSKILKLTFRISKADSPANEVFIGTQVSDHISLKPEAAWRMAQFLDATYGRQVEGSTVNLTELLEKPLVLRIVIEKTNMGNDRNRVQRFEPVTKWQQQAGPGEPSSRPITPGEEISM